MFCNKCGKALEEGSIFCSYCGTKLELIGDDPQNSTPGGNNGEPSFTMPIKDVFTVSGRGTVIEGTVETGKVSVGDEITIPGCGEGRYPVDGIAIGRDLVQSASEGDDVGLLISRLARDLDLIGKKAMASANEYRGDVPKPDNPGKGKTGGFAMDFLSSKN